MKHPKFIHSPFTVFIYFTVTRCPAILTRRPTIPFSSDAVASPLNFVCSISNHVSVTGKPSSSISSYASSSCDCSKGGIANFFGSGLNSVRAVSLLPLLISMCASQSSSALLLPVNRKAPVRISMTVCSRPGPIRDMKSSILLKLPLLSRSETIAFARFVSSPCMCISPMKMVFSYMVVLYVLLFMHGVSIVAPSRLASCT